ncbi:MAG: efflux RND transporter periplasmic adaptor subunit [Flavobacteriales bacterium]|nr:efflux RND transporter periplasmic adaptor subunit [Flavobacteriales bacterium]
MSKTIRYIIIAVVILMIVGVIGKKQGWFGESSSIEVEIDYAARRTIIETVSASGKIQPEKEVKLAPEVSGEIVDLPVVEGQRVSNGELLVRINPDLIEAAVDRAEASLNQSRANLSSSRAQLVEAENNYDRNEPLHKKGVISTAQWDQIVRAYEVAKLGVESAEAMVKNGEASLKEARDNLARTTIYAPDSGTISALHVELGERVVGTNQMQGTELMRIANLNNMEVVVNVNETDIVRVEVGDSVDIEVDAYLDHEFKGIVTEIASSADLVNVSADQVTNFEVKIRILRDSYTELGKNGKSPFRPGMTATVDIITEVAKDILTVPIQSVTTRNDTSSSATRLGNRFGESDERFEVIFLYEEGKAVLKAVETGVQDDTFIEITSGVSDSTEIITGPYRTVAQDLLNNDIVEKK